MCESNHLTTKTNQNKMPADGLLSSNSSERWTNSDPGHIHPNPNGPDFLDGVATKTLCSSSVQPNCSSDFQSHRLSSSQSSFEDVHTAPNWRNRLTFSKENEAHVNLVNAESTRNVEQCSIEKESDNVPSSVGTEQYELGSLVSPAKNTGEPRQQFYGDKTKTASNSGRLGMFEVRSCSSESESTQEHVTYRVNGETNFIEDIKGKTVNDDKRNFCSDGSETETDADKNEIETIFKVSADTNPCFGRDFETRSRLESCTETKTDLGKVDESEIGFEDTGKVETGLGQHSSEKYEKITSAVAKFDASAIGTVTHELLQRTLGHVSYDPQRCRVLSHDLAGQILTTILGLAPKGYKLVTFVSIGSLTDSPGIQFGSRCLWDADTDQLTTVRYANQTLFAVVMVYGLYRE